MGTHLHLEHKIETDTLLPLRYSYLDQPFKQTTDTITGIYADHRPKCASKELVPIARSQHGGVAENIFLLSWIRSQKMNCALASRRSKRMGRRIRQSREKATLSSRS